MGGAIPEGATNVSPLSAPLEGFEVSVLFLVFVGISVSWEVVLGLLTFFNNLLRGKQANWLMRVKEELLALGVVSLVLLFLEPVISQICKPSDYTTDWVPPEDTADIQGAYYFCPPGTRNVFPAGVIHAAHYLLFYLAVVHILFNMLTNSITSQKFDCMVILERKARNQDMAHEQAMVQARLQGEEAIDETVNPLLAPTEVSSSSSRSGSGSGSSSSTGSGEKKPKSNLRLAWESSVVGKGMAKLWWLVKRSVDQKSFCLLRKVCILRFEAHAMDSNVRSFSYVNIASQVLEADLEQVYAHAWLMIMFMTFLLMYPRVVYQVIWANAICLIAVAAMSWKVHHVLHDTVDICKKALQKGVEQQRHLRKAEKSLLLAGSDLDSSESGGSTEAASAAKSFIPYKRAASMKRNAIMTREEQLGVFRGLSPPDQPGTFPSLSRADGLQGVPGSIGLAGRLPVPGVGGSGMALLPGMGEREGDEDEEEEVDADHIIEAYQRRQQKEAAKKQREVLEKERSAHLANTMKWVIGTSRQAEENDSSAGRGGQQLVLMQEQLHLLQRLQRQRSGTVPPSPPGPPNPPPPVPPPHDAATSHLAPHPSGQSLTTRRSGSLLPTMHSVNSSQPHVALMPMMPGGVHTVRFAGHHTSHPAGNHTAALPHSHHHSHSHHHHHSHHHNHQQAAQHAGDVAGHTFGHAAGRTAAETAAASHAASSQPGHAWHTRRGSMPRNPVLLDGKVPVDRQQQVAPPTAGLLSQPDNTYVRGTSGRVAGGFFTQGIASGPLSSFPPHHSITINAPVDQLGLKPSGSVPQGWSTGVLSPTSSSQTAASAATAGGRAAVPTSWSVGGATATQGTALQAHGAVQAVQVLPKTWSTGLVNLNEGATGTTCAGSTVLQPAEPAVSVPQSWTIAGVHQASPNQVPITSTAAVASAAVQKPASSRSWTIGCAGQTATAIQTASPPDNLGGDAGQAVSGWTLGMHSNGQDHMQPATASVQAGTLAGVGDVDWDSVMANFNKQFLDYSQQQVQEHDGTGLMPGWNAGGSKRHDHSGWGQGTHQLGSGAYGNNSLAAPAVRASSLRREGSARRTVFPSEPGSPMKVRFAGTHNGANSQSGSSSSSGSRRGQQPPNSIKLTYRGPARADAIVDAKHARERAKGHYDPSADEPHLPYKTLAELAEVVEERVKQSGMLYPILALRRDLFWFRHPHFLLWMVNIIFLISSLSITTAVALVIPYNKFQKLASLKQDTVIWLPVVVTDVIMAMYLSWHVLPLYALITTAGTSFPDYISPDVSNPVGYLLWAFHRPAVLGCLPLQPRVIEEVRAAKTLAHDDYHGISGMILGFLNHVFVGVEHKERQESLDLATYFVTSLSDHAGIVLSPHLRSLAAKGAVTVMAQPQVRDVLREFAQYWHDVAWYGPPEDDYVIKADLSFMRAAFGELDADGSGALSFGELAQMVRSLGALATAGDIETMLWEVDLDGSRSVGFDEFTKFLAYAFFDMDANGFIGVDEVEDSMLRLGFKKATPEACAMLMSAADHNGDGRLGMREFFMLFEKLLVEEDEDEDGSGSGDGSSNSSKKKGGSDKS